MDPWFLIAASVLALYSVGDNESVTKASGALIVGALAVIMAIGGIAQASGPWISSGAKKLASEATVVNKPGAFPDTNTDHIVIVPEQAARNAAKGVVAQAGGNFMIGTLSLQSVDNHAYWIVSLDPKNWRPSTINYTIPGYIVVDAENPDAQAVYRTTDANNKKIQIHYSSQAMFSMKLQRYVWEHGYAGKVLDDWNMEVNDQWEPFYTASVNRITLNFKETIPNGLVTVDASSGKIKEYALDKRPAWIDRIYSAATAKTIVNWWGAYNNGSMGFLKMGRSKNQRFKVSGEPSLVYTNEDYPVWQMVVTVAQNDDGSGQFLALFDGRTSTVRLYEIPNLVTEQSVIDNVRNTDKATDLIPAHLAIHKIDGYWTWVGTLIPGDNAASSSSAGIQGYVLLPADQTISGANIARSTTTFKDALSKYRALRAGDNSAEANKNATEGVTTSTIGLLAKDVVGGNSVVSFTLAGDTHLYEMQVTVGDHDSNVERRFAKPGKKVTVKYRDNGSNTRAVLSYDDLTLQLTG